MAMQGHRQVVQVPRGLDSLVDLPWLLRIFYRDNFLAWPPVAQGHGCPTFFCERVFSLEIRVCPVI